MIRHPRRLSRYGTRLARFQHACPDCSAAADVIAYQHLLTVVEISHDDTCPTYRALQERRTRREPR